MRKLIITLLVSLVIVYLAISFVEMSINPKEWHIVTRMICMAGELALLIAFYNRMRGEQSK